MRKLQPVTETFIGAAGNHLAADRYGQAGDPVILLHGGGQTRNAWGGSAASLADEGRVAYTIDQRGHGDSDWVEGGDYRHTSFAADLLKVADEVTRRHGRAPIAIGASFGGLIALHTYSIDPNQFGFPMLVSLLAMVVLGGRRSIYGPIVGATILTLLPEIARPLSDNRTLIHGMLLILIIVFLPKGVVDSLRGLSLRKPRARQQQRVAGDVPST